MMEFSGSLDDHWIVLGPLVSSGPAQIDAVTAKLYDPWHSGILRATEEGYHLKALQAVLTLSEVTHMHTSGQIEGTQ